MAVDVWGWLEFWDRCRQGLVPYVHFTKEYPAGAGLLYWALAPLVPREGAAEILVAHGSVMAVADALNTGLFFLAASHLAPRRAPLLTAFFALNLTSVLLTPFRFESVLVTALLLGLLAEQRGRTHLATACWSVAAALKWFPVFFIAARDLHDAFVHGRRRQWLHSAAILGGVLAAVNLPFLLLGWLERGSLDQWLATYSFHVRRHLYKDTVLGVVELWLGPFPPERWGSHLAGALVFLALWRGRRLPVERSAVLVCAASLLLNRVYSPQFHLWFYPFLLLAAASAPAREARWLLGLFLGLDLLNTLVYPAAFTLALPEVGGHLDAGQGPRSGGPWTVVFSLAVLARAALLLVLAGVLLRAPSPARGDAAVGSPGPPPPGDGGRPGPRGGV